MWEEKSCINSTPKIHNNLPFSYLFTHWYCCLFYFFLSTRFSLSLTLWQSLVFTSFNKKITDMLLHFLLHSQISNDFNSLLCFVSWAFSFVLSLSVLEFWFWVHFAACVSVHHPLRFSERPLALVKKGTVSAWGMDPFLGYRSVPDQYLLTGRNPVFFPIWLKQLRIAGIYSGMKLMYFCTG